MDPVLESELLVSITSNRLVIVAGAGLSMAPPTNSPSANALLARCIKLYEYFTSSKLPSTATSSLESLAEHFLANGTFGTLFIDKMLRTIREFYETPNTGHYAVSDFLGSAVVQLCLSTNLDVLIEKAAAAQGDVTFKAALDGDEANDSQPYMPLLKIHGCFGRDPQNTLWAPSQLVNNTILADRINSASTWLAGILRQRDVVFIGFWSDWNYLNSVVSSAIRTSNPSKVFLVDPLDIASLETKAPDLHAWATSQNFLHVKTSGAQFLDELRTAYSKNFITRVLADSSESYLETFGAPPILSGTEFDAISSDGLYKIRKDICGVPQNEPVRVKFPDEKMALVGTMMLRVLASGGTITDNIYTVNGKKVRIVDGGGRLLSKVSSSHILETYSPLEQVDFVLSTAHDDGGVPRNLIRSNVTSPGIVRSGATEPWLAIEQSFNFLR